MGMLNDSYMWCKYQLPHSENVGHSIKSIHGLSLDREGSHTAQMILRQQPLLTSIIVSRSFFEASEILIEPQDNEELVGGQQMLVVGHIKSEALPSELGTLSRVLSVEKFMG